MSDERNVAGGQGATDEMREKRGGRDEAVPLSRQLAHLADESQAVLERHRDV